MKKKQHTDSPMRITRNPMIGRAITRGRFTPDLLAPGVLSDMLEGRRTDVKIRDGAMSNGLPVTVSKWQL
jgi:hypothetical protein